MDSSVIVIQQQQHGDMAESFISALFSVLYVIQELYSWWLYIATSHVCYDYDCYRAAAPISRMLFGNRAQSAKEFHSSVKYSAIYRATQLLFISLFLFTAMWTKKVESVDSIRWLLPNGRPRSCGRGHCPASSFQVICFFFFIILFIRWCV